MQPFRSIKLQPLQVVLFAILSSAALAVPKKFNPDADSVAVAEAGDSNALISDERGPAPRFGIQTNTIATTGATGLFPGLNPGPIKLDLGGLLLGAVLGLGAVLVLPKLLHAVGPLGYDGYKRSEDSSGGGLTELLSRVDAALARHHVDSSACVQRAVCSAVEGAEERVRHGHASTIDSAVHALAQTDIMGLMLDGTAVKSAIDVGRRGGDCAASFAGCIATRDALVAVVRGLASMGANSDADAATGGAAVN